MSVTFGLPILVQFLSDPCFILQITCLLHRHFTSLLHCLGKILGWVHVYCLWSSTKESARAMNKQVGEGGIMQVAKILARNLLRQAEAQSWVSVRFLVPHGTGEASFVDNARVQHRCCDCDTFIDPYTYV